MTALAARVGLVASRDVPATLTALGFWLGALIAVAGFYDLVALPRRELFVYALLAAGVARFALVKRALPEPQQTLTLLALVVAAALLVAEMVEGEAYALVGPAAVVGLGALIRTRPTVGVTAAFLFAAFAGTLLAVLDTDPYKFVDASIGALAAAVVLQYLSRGRDRRAVPVLGAILVAIVIAVARVYAEFAAVPEVGSRAFHVFGFYMLLLLAMAYGPWGHETHRRMAKAVLVGVLIVAGYAVLRWIIGPSAAERQVVLSDVVGARYNFAEGKLRLFGSFVNTRSLGAWAAVVLPVCVALAIHFRGRWRLASVVAAVLAFAALIGSGMRGGVPAAALGCLVVVGVMTYSRAGGGLRLNVAAVAAVGLIVAFGALAAVSPDPTVSERSYQTILDPSRDAAYQERLYKWSVAWREADQRPFGHGLGTAGVLALSYQRFPTVGANDVDNSYLKVAVDQGLFGLALFAAALIALLIGLVRRSLRTHDPQRAALGAAGAGVTASFMVVMWSGNYLEGMPAVTAWLIVGLGVGQFATVALRR